MRHIILDTNILIIYPQIVAVQEEFIIPDVVLFELEDFANKNNQYKDIVENIKSSDLINIAKTKTSILEGITGELEEKILSYTDARIINLALEYSELHANEPVYIATEDKLLARVCEKLGIQTIKLAELAGKIYKVDIDNELFKKAKLINKKSYKQLFINVITSILVSIALTIFVKYFDLVVSTIKVWGMILLLPILGILFFYIRSKWRLIYGMTEFFIGIISSLTVFFPNFNYSGMNGESYLKILAGLYIMVRGLDNIEKGIEGTRFAYLWGKIFK